MQNTNATAALFANGTPITEENRQNLGTIFSTRGYDHVDAKAAATEVRTFQESPDDNNHLVFDRDGNISLVQVTSGTTPQQIAVLEEIAALATAAMHPPVSPSADDLGDDQIKDYTNVPAALIAIGTPVTEENRAKFSSPRQALDLWRTAKSITEDSDARFSYPDYDHVEMKSAGTEVGTFVDGNQHS